MSERLDPAALREYAGRAWGRARDAKRRYWRARLVRGGMAEALRVTDVMRCAMLATNPSWPDREDREEDLQARSSTARRRRRSTS
jgi:hypothetical protein